MGYYPISYGDDYHEVIGAAEGMSKGGIFQWLLGRGLTSIQHVIGNKCIGMLESILEAFALTKYQRGGVHFCRNVFATSPESKTRIVAKKLEAIHAIENKPKQEPRAQVRTELKEAVTKLEACIEEIITYMVFSFEH